MHDLQQDQKRKRAKKSSFIREYPLKRYYLQNVGGNGSPGLCRRKPCYANHAMPFTALKVLKLAFFAMHLAQIKS